MSETVVSRPHAVVLSGRTWKVLATVGAVSALIAGSTFWFREHSASRAAPAFRFETAKVERGVIRAKVTATGTVNPIVTVQVGAQVSGTIQALGADFNSVVTPGQMMAQIDPRLFKAAVQQAHANFLSAKA